MILDDYNNIKFDDTNSEDLKKLNLYTNPNYWISLKGKVSSSTIANRKKDYLSIANKYNLFKLKDEVCYTLFLKFLELMNIKNNKDVT